MKRIILIISVLAFINCSAQSILQPGFDPLEYQQLLSLAFHKSSIADSILRRTTTDPYKLVYRSPEMGLKNLWTLYLRDDQVAVIDLRGTINHNASWAANFYAAMLPAKGIIHTNDSTEFHYQFAVDDKAMVHAGWTVAIAHLAPDVTNKIMELYRNKKIREFLVFGHSQGGALAFLMRSYLEYEKKAGRLPADLLLKTYCSAGPKPGNMYYAYDFDFITKNGWGFNVVNTADWVPEMPFSIQQITDLNPTNPVIHAPAILKKQKLLVRIAGKMVYGKLTRHPRKAQKKFEHYLGTVFYKKGVHKILPHLKEPEYTSGNNYMRAGTPIILMADEGYRERFPESDRNFFVHHLFAPYYFLLQKWYGK